MAVCLRLDGPIPGVGRVLAFSHNADRSRSTSKGNAGYSANTNPHHSRVWTLFATATYKRTAG